MLKCTTNIYGNQVMIRFLLLSIPTLFLFLVPGVHATTIEVHSDPSFDLEVTNLYGSAYQYSTQEDRE